MSSKLRCKSAFHQFLHFAHGLLDADECGAGDDAVADVEFGNLRYRDDGLDVLVGQAVPGVDGQALGVGVFGGASRMSSSSSSASSAETTLA